MPARTDVDARPQGTNPLSSPAIDRGGPGGQAVVATGTSCLPHPVQHLSLYFVVPLLINAGTALYLTRLSPESALLVLRLPGFLVGVSWGWAGLLLCVVLGVMLGLPIAAFQTAYIRYKLAQVAQGADLPKALCGPTTAVALSLPWLMAAPIAYVVGYFWLFPPLGGALLAANLLWVRVVLYGEHLRVYQYHKAYLAQQCTTGAVPDTA